MVRQQRFTEEEKAEIQKAHEAGVPYKALAVRYGVSAATIMRVCRPDTYERQLAANRKYQSDNIKKINAARKIMYKNYRLSFHSVNDAAVIDHLDKQENVTDYVRQLVIGDINTDASKEDDSCGEN